MSAAAKTAVTDARVVDGAMIASFMGAEPPKVWRADMKNLSTATFEMQEADGLFQIVMKSGAEQENIAAFATRDGATHALQALMGAMMSPSGTAVGTAASVSAGEKKSSGFVRFLKGLLKLAVWIGGLLIIFALLSMLLAPRLSRMLSDPGITKVQQGAPIPADELFGE